MFKSLFSGIVSGIAVKLLEDYRQLSIQLLKIEAAKTYVKGVQVARSSAIGLMWMGLVIALICIGAGLFHVGLFYLLPWTTESKAILGMVLGLAYMVGGGVALRAAMDERVWMEKSGASKMLRDATGRDDRLNDR
jgi:hypothetical protein